MSNQEQSAPKLMIVLRGLMVFCFDRKSRSYEVGVLPAPGHGLFINTYRNAMPKPGANRAPDETLSLERWADPRRLHWELEVPGSKGTGISKHLKDPFSRHDQSTSDPNDFRWIVDLESAEFHAEKLALKTGKLKPIMHFSEGKLSTLELTEPLIRQRGDVIEENFGAVAAATVLTLPASYGDPALRVRGTGEKIFQFKYEPTTFYEIVNIPPSQIPGAHTANSTAVAQVSVTRPHLDETQANDCCTPDDFQNYYELFNIPVERRFKLALAEAPPIPDPYKCGGVELGARDEPLA